MPTNPCNRASVWRTRHARCTHLHLGNERLKQPRPSLRHRTQLLPDPHLWVARHSPLNKAEDPHRPFTIKTCIITRHVPSQRHNKSTHASPTCPRTGTHLNQAVPHAPIVHLTRARPARAHCSIDDSAAGGQQVALQMRVRAILGDVGSGRMVVGRGRGKGRERGRGGNMERSARNGRDAAASAHLYMISIFTASQSGRRLILWRWPSDQHSIPCALSACPGCFCMARMASEYAGSRLLHACAAISGDHHVGAGAGEAHLVALLAREPLFAVEHKSGNLKIVGAIRRTTTRLQNTRTSH